MRNESSLSYILLVQAVDDDDDHALTLNMFMNKLINNS